MPLIQMVAWPDRNRWAKGLIMRSILVLTLSCFSSAAFADLIAHWRFDEPAGSAVTADETGNHIGTLLNGADFTAGGVAGNAIELHRATNDLVSMGDVLGLNGATNFTIQCWVKTSDSAEAFPIAKHRSGVLAGWICGINPSGGAYGEQNKPWFYTANSPGGEVRGTTVVNDGQWHQIVTVFIAGNQKRMYVDGAPIEGTNIANDPTPVSAPLLVGGLEASGSPTNFFEGLVDEVQIYSQALGDADVQFLFENPGLTVCGADFNRDDAIDFFDVLGFLQAFTSLDPRADINLDGAFDFFDVLAFLAAFDAGCA